MYVDYNMNGWHSLLYQDTRLSAVTDFSSYIAWLHPLLHFNEVAAILVEHVSWADCTEQALSVL